MTVKELIKELEQHYQDAEILVGSDEELNTIRNGIEVAQLENDQELNQVIIYGLDGSEQG